MYSNDSRLLSVARNISEGPMGPAQEVPQSISHCPAALVVTSGRGMAQRWPASCLWTALHQAVQFALPFTQINSDNTVLPE